MPRHFPKLRAFNLIALILIIAFVFAGAYLLLQREESSIEPEPAVPGTTGKTERIEVDLNGDGEKEYVVLGYPEDELDAYLVSMKAYDKSGREIASLPPEISIKVPSPAIDVHTLDESSPREFFNFYFSAGTHQFETMFFELRNDYILPVCFTKFTKDVTGPYDCLFYTGNADGFIINDLDGDGTTEVVETVDEYPGDGELSKEEEAAIQQGFEEFGVSEFAEGARRIALREKGGRGRNVAWGIYSYNGEYFEPQEGEDFERYFAILKEEMPDMIRKSDLSQGSLEYNEFVRDFWSRR